MFHPIKHDFVTLAAPVCLGVGACMLHTVGCAPLSAALWLQTFLNPSHHVTLLKSACIYQLVTPLTVFLVVHLFLVALWLQTF